MPPAKTISWPTAARSPQLAANEVHVWAAPLDVSAALRKRLAATLSADERERADKFKIENLRQRFVTGRGALRDVLGRCLQCDPAELEFIQGWRGKPALAPKFTDRGIHFNLAHSAELALIAVTRAGPVGVDVERIRPVKDADELVARFFSPRESDSFQQLAAGAKPEAFFRLWTRKEAFLKATGEGLARALDAVEVSFLPGEPARVIALAGDAPAAARWSLHALAPAPGFVGAVAIEVEKIEVRCWKWEARQPGGAGRKFGRTI